MLSGVPRGSCTRLLSCPQSKEISVIFTRHHLTLLSGARSRYPLKRPVFSSDVSVQTENVAITFHSPTRIESNKLGHLDDQESTLTATDLAAILKWSKDISSDINLSAGNSLLLMKPFPFSEIETALKRLTEIATGEIFNTLTNDINQSPKFRNIGI